MILYHGSYLPVEKPDISFSRNNVDFGRGFYTSPIKEQAASWADRFKQKGGRAVISSYQFEESAIEANNIPVLKFDSYSEEWLDYIVLSRLGKNKDEFALVIGGVANDKVFDTIQLFLDGLIDKLESIRRLRFQKPNIQYCFRNQTLINTCLSFISSEVST